MKYILNKVINITRASLFVMFLAYVVPVINYVLFNNNLISGRQNFVILHKEIGLLTTIHLITYSWVTIMTSGPGFTSPYAGCQAGLSRPRTIKKIRPYAV